MGRGTGCEIRGMRAHALHLVRRIHQSLEGCLHFRPGKGPDARHHPQAAEGRKTRKVRKALERLGHLRQELAQIEARRIEDELIVFRGCHVLLVHVLVRLVIAHPVAGPAEGLQPDGFQAASHGRKAHQIADRIGSKLEQHPFPEMACAFS